MALRHIQNDSHLLVFSEADGRGTLVFSAGAVTVALTGGLRDGDGVGIAGTATLTTGGTSTDAVLLVDFLLVR